MNFDYISNEAINFLTDGALEWLLLLHVSYDHVIQQLILLVIRL